MTRAPEVPAPQPVETVYVPPAEPAPPVVVEAPAPAPVPVATATGGGMGWLLPVLGVIGLGGLIAAVASSSNG